MDIDLGPVVVDVLILLAVVFLFGFVAILAVTAILFRKLKREPLRSHPLFLVLVLALSILGGYTAVQLLYQWDKAEERAFWAERSTFSDEMARQYPLEMQHDPHASQPFTIVFGVPADGVYHLHVIGFADGQTSGSNLWDNKVIEIHNYSVPFSAGTHEVSFGFLPDVAQVETIQSINLVVIIQPDKPREKLFNTQKGIAVTNPGSVVLTEGIDYYSPNLYAMNGCLSNIYQWVPCVEHDQLHVVISR